MGSNIRSRLAVLLTLAVLGVAVAGIGATLGAPSGTTADADTRFVVTEQNVTVATDQEEVTVTDDMSNVTSVRVEEAAAGQFSVETERAQPLTERERERAKRIARTNETVQTHLAEGEYTLDVDAIQRLDTTAMQVSGNVTERTESGNVTVIRYEAEAEETADDSVVVDREPTYVPNEAVVRFRDPTASERTDLKYSVDVDLTNETVTDVIDWAEIRQHAPTINGTEISPPATNSTA
jgi:hypothetical protein